MREAVWGRENESVAWTECRSSKFIDSTKPKILEICVSSYNVYDIIIKSHSYFKYKLTLKLICMYVWNIYNNYIYVL